MIATQAPTNARGKLLSLIFALTVITYLDRLCISAAAPAIRAEFGFSATQMGYIFSAFTFAYAVFEVPSGWFGDRYGARLALTRIVLWWSAFTILTGAAFGFWSLFAMRFLFGAGEAGAFPNIARAISRWMPASHQGRGLSRAFLGLSVGSAATAPLVFTLLELQGWRWTFVEFGLIGALWSFIWYRWFRDNPADHPGVNEAELKLIGTHGEAQQTAPSHSLPWRMILGSRNMIFICLMYFAFGYGLYFYITWLPTYLIEGRGFSIGSTKWLAALPWAVSAPAFIFGGWLTDRLVIATGSLRIARCGVGAAGYALSAASLIAVANIENNLAAALLLALALCFQNMTASAAWGVCLDVGRRHAGVVTGLMNTAGNIGGAIAPILAGYAVKNYGSWVLPFYVMAGVFVFGMAMWLCVNPRKVIA